MVLRPEMEEDHLLSKYTILHVRTTLSLLGAADIVSGLQNFVLIRNMPPVGCKCVLSCL